MNDISIETISEELDLGESLRCECPSCGASDRTFSITRTMDGTVLYQCFRASCGYSGALSGAYNYVRNPVPRRKAHVDWEGTTRELDADVRAWISREWGLIDPPHWWYTDDYGGRIAMSIRDPRGRHRGWCLRAPAGPRKALTYLNEEEVGLSWYKRSPDVGTVLVEDIPSALRASSHLNAVALLGTGIGEDRAAEIAEYAPRPLYCALDQDATDKSLTYVSKYRMLWDQPRVMLLEKDLKNLTEEELKDKL